MNERAYLLTRCLKLESRIAWLEGQAENLPYIEKALVARRIQRYASVDEIAQMRNLREKGRGVSVIALALHVSAGTVRKYTRDIVMSKE